MNTAPKILAHLALIAAVAGCVGTDVGNPPDDNERVIARLEFSTYEDDGSSDSGTAGQTNAAAGTNSFVPNGLVAVEGAEVFDIWLSVERIVLTEGEGCGETTERTVDGPFFVDLDAGEVYPEAPIIAESETTICSVRLVLSPAKQRLEGVPEQLDGKSIWLVGETSGGEPIELTTATQHQLDYNGVEFDVSANAGTEVGYIAAFVPDDWFTEIPLDRPAPVDISDSASSADIASFVTALRTGSRIVRDADADRRVGPAEFDAPVATPR